MPKPSRAKRAQQKKAPSQAALLKHIAGILATVELVKPKRGAAAVSATDYSVVLPAMQRGLSVDLSDAAKLYEQHKGIIELVLGQLGSTGAQIRALLPLLIALLGSMSKPKPEPQPAPAPAPTPAPPVPTPGPAPAPPPVGVVQGYASLRLVLRMFSKDNGKIVSRDEYEKKVTGNDGAQMVKEKAHMDISPFDQAGREIRTGDPRHVEPDSNGYPQMRYRWWIDGVQQQDTGDDHFNLGSIFDRDDPEHHYDAGCTPTLKLERAWGSGKGRAEFEAFMPAQFNGPYGEVTSNRVSWFVD
jgi:hypothetical protein